MESPAARASETTQTHEPVMIDAPAILVVETEPTISDTAPALLARVRASLRAAKAKTVGASQRSPDG